MIKVKVIEPYKDLELKRTTTVGEQLEVSKERAKVLLEKKLVELVEKSVEEFTESKKATQIKLRKKD